MEHEVIASLNLNHFPEIPERAVKVSVKFLLFVFVYNDF